MNTSDPYDREGGESHQQRCSPDCRPDSGNAQKICVHIRWMIRRDMPEVLDIENQSFECPWSEEDFIRCLRQRNCVGKVSEFDERVVAFMIYEFQKTRFHILNFAVRQAFRRKSVGKAMAGKLIGKLSWQRRNSIVLEVREKNLEAQMFFKKQGFRAISVLRDFYDDTTEDAYLMQYKHSASKESENGSVPLCKGSGPMTGLSAE